MQSDNKAEKVARNESDVWLGYLLGELAEEIEKFRNFDVEYGQ